MHRGRTFKGMQIYIWGQLGILVLNVKITEILAIC